MLERMNQVSVSEFFAKSKEEMYDDAVAMVEKYNRLVDICNDSAERMAEFMAKDDINEFKKELQSKEPGELKIQKLADIVVWADGIIRDAGYNEEKYKSDGATAYCHVKAHELWRIRDVALKSMERQTVYSNALNQDIAAKAAKIDLLEKEIEGRKEGYYVLKEKMDAKYISIEEHNNICKSLGEKVERQRENLDNINKTLEIRTKENERLIAVKKNQEREIEAHEEENARLSKRIMEKNQAINTANDAIVSLRKGIEKLKVDLIHEREKNEKLARAHAELENDIRRVSKERDSYAEKVNDLRLFNAIDMELFSRLNIKGEDDRGRAGFKKYIEWLVKEEETKFKESWKARLNEELEAIFKEKEEETEVNDIPCGSDSIE